MRSLEQRGEKILEEVHLIGIFLFEAIFMNSQSDIYFTL